MILSRLFQIVLGAKQPNIFHRKTTSAFGEWNVVVVMQINLRTTFHTAAFIPAPYLNLYMRWN